jgi:1-acyl-sn-glycerol-3-phosphate acyltransferase
MRVAFSISYWAFAGLSLAVLFPGAVLLYLLTRPFDRRLVWLHLYTCMWGYMYVAFHPLWSCHFEGRRKLPWKTAAVIVPNHLSLVDILVIHGTFRPFKWVSKVEMFRVPFIGWTMSLNEYVKVRRGERESVKQMLAACRAHLARGSSLVIFPEGTRARDGKMGTFKDGAFKLAAEAGVPVIPVAIHGSGLALPVAGLIFRNKVRVKVRVLDPLDPKAFPSVDALRDAAREVIAKNVAELAALDG